MALGLLGEKLGMTQWFDAQGGTQAATVIRIQPNRVVQVKTQQKDGYNALQLGYAPTKDQRVSKPVLGHFKRAGLSAMKTLREFHLNEVSIYQPGQKLTAAIFEVGEKINVRGRSKGKGMTGAMKRYGFAGGQHAHGHSEAFRKLLSVGNMRATGKVFKGKKMHGHMGDEWVMVKALEVLKVDVENQVLVVGGAVPGAKFGVLELIKRG
ncbi:MAG TPA: 50S ribosomal protein L3 [Candidatus Bipolaricaulota bacterium]